MFRSLAVLAILAAGSGVAVAADEPVSLSRLDSFLHKDFPTSPDLLSAAGRPIQPLQQGFTNPQMCGTVFGYLPYWESAQYLRYDLLTHIACFSIEVKYDGSIVNSRGWPWTSVINAAHAKGVKVILVATLFNGTDINTLITNTTYTNNFLANMKAKMLQGSADGINIDFEGSGAAWKSNINAFMSTVTTYMHTQLPGSEVTFAGPAVNWSSEWNLAGLANSCDGIFIMGYAFYGSWSTTSGPNSPLTGGSYNITNTVNTQYASVTPYHPEKLILGLPYYGGHWKTATSAARSTVTAWVGSTRFKDDEPASQTYGLLWDATSQTPWYRWNDGTSWHQVWFDNAQSLGLKYDLARSKNLQGVGMWALGYDGSRPELWNTLAMKYRCRVAADFDRDGDVDGADYGTFAGCFNGTGTPIETGCSAADLNGDHSVDGVDFGLFATCFNGSGNPPPCR